MGIRYLSVGLLVLVGTGCKFMSRESTSDTLAKTKKSAPALYPVDPQVHLSDKTKNALDPKSFEPSVLNAVAYARYGVGIIERNTQPADAKAIALNLAKNAQNSISAERTLAYFSLAGSEEDFKKYQTEVLAHAEGSTPDSKLQSVGRRIFDAQKQLEACQNDPLSPNKSATDCCKSLAYPWFLMNSWDSYSETERAELVKQSKSANFYQEHLTAYLALKELDVVSGKTKSLQPFEQIGTKAWLSACSAPLAGLPESLAQFKKVYGDFHSDKKWTSQLHPTSAAKLAGRRLYHARNSNVSIAETIGDKCEVRETEIVVTNSDRMNDFLTYDTSGKRVPHGYFPAKLGTDAVKFTPDACMNCHYTFDTREFTVRIPSYQALQLEFRIKDGVPQYKDHSKCLKEGELLVHDNPAHP